jgi:hypothetical protein
MEVDHTEESQQGRTVQVQEESQVTAPTQPVVEGRKRKARDSRVESEGGKTRKANTRHNPSSPSSPATSTSPASRRSTSRSRPSPSTGRSPLPNEAVLRDALLLYLNHSGDNKRVVNQCAQWLTSAVERDEQLMAESAEEGNKSAGSSTALDFPPPHFRLIIHWPTVRSFLSTQPLLLDILLCHPNLAQRTTQWWVRQVLHHTFSQSEWKDHPMWRQVQLGYLRVLLVVDEVVLERCEGEDGREMRTVDSCVYDMDKITNKDGRLVEFEGVVIAASPVKHSKSAHHSTPHCATTSTTRSHPVLLCLS